MPISIDEFESREADTPTNTERVLRYLERNPDEEHKAAEIAETTGVAENSVHPVLHHLAERGLVRHDEPHWSLDDH